MSKSLLICFVFSLISVIGFSQNTEQLLIGSWKFAEVESKKKLDKKELLMVQMFFSDMTFYFTEDKKFSFFAMGKEDIGTWEVRNNNLLVTYSIKGEISDFDLVSVSEKQFIFQFDDKGSFIMEKVDLDDDKSIELPIIENEIKVKEEQIAQKWYFKSKEIDKSKELKFFTQEEMQKMTNNVLKGNYFSFLKNGKFDNFTKVLGEEVYIKGDWKLLDNNTIYIYYEDGGGTHWNINKISDNELILSKGLTPEKWTFSIEEQID